MKKMTLLIVNLFLSFITSVQVYMTGIVSNDSMPLESVSVIIKNNITGIVTNSNEELKLKAKKEIRYRCLIWDTKPKD